MGTGYTIPNISLYLLSYYKYQGYTDLTVNDIAFLLPILGFSNSMSLGLGGWLENRYGPRK
jgi:hypothetical protein